MRATTFKQIGSLFAGSTIDGNRMICLTKYVTVRVSKGEPNLYDAFWLARVSAVYRLPLCGHVCVCVCVYTRARAGFIRDRVLVHTGAPMLSRRCINCKIEISASTIITIVNAPTLLPVRYRIRSGSHRSVSKARYDDFQLLNLLCLLTIILTSLVSKVLR